MPYADVIAHHEAGHAVMRIRLGLPLKEVRIFGAVDSEGKPALGAVDPGEEPVTGHAPWMLDVREVLAAMAGPAAEQRHAGRYDESYAGWDFQNARAIVEEMSGQLNDDSPIVVSIVGGTLGQCTYMFDNEPALWQQVAATAGELVRHGSLSKTEVQEIMRLVKCPGEKATDPRFAHLERHS